jgi:Flp pilus assembly protein TadD
VTVLLCDLGHVLFEAGRDEEAAELLGEAADAGHSWVSCKSEYGGALHRLGRTAEAREYLHRTLLELEAARDPKAESVRDMLAWVESDAGI